MARDWPIEEARHNFAVLVDAALGGEPQAVTLEDGREVIVSTGESSKRTGQAFKQFLPTGGFTEDEEADAFDRILQDIRGEGRPFILPRTTENAV